MLGVSISVDITSGGYAEAYPNIFGEMPRSVVAEAMDIASSGHFRQVPRFRKVPQGVAVPCGSGGLSDPRSFGTPPFAVEPFGLAVTTLGQIKHTALLQNFPNPFNPEMWLPYLWVSGRRRRDPSHLQR